MNTLALGENDPRGHVWNLGYRATSLVRCLPTALFHFLFVESRCIILVWLTGYLSAIRSQTFRVEKELWTFTSVFGIMNLTILMYVAAFVGINTIFMVRTCGFCASFEDGRYLAYSYSLETTNRYKIMVYLLMFLIWGSFGCSFIFLCFLPGEHDKQLSPEGFFKMFGSQFMAVVGLTGALLYEGKQYKDNRLGCEIDFVGPDVDWNTDTFKDIKYTRTIRDLFVETNDAFAARLTIACWKAKGKKFRSLWNFVHDDSLEEALKIEAI